MGSPNTEMGSRPGTRKLGPAALVAAAVILVNACASGPRVTLNPVTPEPTGRHEIGKFVWYDLLTEDVPAVKRFYADLFGWRYEEIQGKGVVYTVIKHDGAAIGGIVALEDDDDRVPSSRWLSLLSVPDVDRAVEQVKEAGGVINMGPRDYPERGRLALVTDPQGAMVVLFRSSGGDPVDDEPVTDRWFWTELWAHDVPAAVELYRSLVGYEVESHEIPGNNDYQVFIRDGRPRAGVIYLPWPEVTPNWLPYVKVDDPVAVARRVEELGGTVIIAPSQSVRAGSAGVVADPSGAAFAIQKWPLEEDTGGGAR